MLIYFHGHAHLRESTVRLNSTLISHIDHLPEIKDFLCLAISEKWPGRAW